jgi:hypothetical protein
MGKIGLMAGTAAIAMFAASAANATTEAGATAVASQPSGQIQLAQADMPPSNAELEARISALESEVQDSEMRAAQAQANPPAAPSGWWDKTSISGRMYWDFTNVSNKNNGVKSANTNGTSFDIKRFYFGVDHTFDSVFSANLTTDVTYDSTIGVNQIYIKKAYLQVKLDPAFTLRIGSADMPWIPYMEGVYGYRYLENTLVDRIKFGNSADWGVHILGSLADGMINYQLSMINGAGYKKAAIYRTDTPDFEGRVSLNYEGFQAALGGYVGHEGVQYSNGLHFQHSYNRFDALAAYTANGIRVGVEYFDASNKGAELSATSTHGYGYSPFASYTFIPQWTVFGRYDYVKPYSQDAAHKAFHNDYYTFGITYSPIRIVDFSLAYKHDAGSNGNIGDSNGTIGGTAFAPGNNGAYDEIGIWSDFQW